MLCFCEKWWSCGLMIHRMNFHGWLLLLMFEKTCCWWIGMLSMPLVNWWWKLLLLLNNFESLVKFWIGTKIMLIHEFWAFWCMCLCTWPINFIWDEFWVWEDQNLSVGEKWFWNSKFFFWTDECSLKRTPSEPQANAPSSFWTQLAWANRERTVSEHKCRFCQGFAWASSKRTRLRRYWDLGA